MSSLVIVLAILAICYDAAAAGLSPNPTPTVVKGDWTCLPNKASTTLSASGSITWKRENCTNSQDPAVQAAPQLVVNVLEVDLTAQDVRLAPAVSQDADQPLQPINAIAAGNSPARNFVAGINGGYFWRTDITPYWIDDVCRKKIRKEALTPADTEPFNPNNGLHDGVIMVDGHVLGSNCDCKGYSRPAILNDGTPATWHIDVVDRGQQGPSDMQNGIAAGPNLVSYNTTGTGADTIAQTFIDIPADDDNINIHEHAANTAVGVIFDTATGKAKTMFLVTTDGSDECGRLDESCGINAPTLASLMKDRYEVHQAMSMDQGGSTTMWVKKEEGSGGTADGVVSYSGGGARNVANGFFIEVVE
jgi:hypothetical protein